MPAKVPLLFSATCGEVQRSDTKPCAKVTDSGVRVERRNQFFHAKLKIGVLQVPKQIEHRSVAPHARHWRCKRINLSLRVRCRCELTKEHFRQRLAGAHAPR